LKYNDLFADKGTYDARKSRFPRAVGLISNYYYKISWIYKSKYMYDASVHDRKAVHIYDL